MSPNSRHRDGRQGKTKRRMRRTLNAARRVLRKTATSGQQAYATLLAVLAQHGGEVTITQGTIDQVTQNYARLGWTVARKGEGSNEFTVKLVEGAGETVEHHADAAGEGERSDVADGRVAGTETADVSASV